MPPILEEILRRAASFGQDALDHLAGGNVANVAREIVGGVEGSCSAHHLDLCLAAHGSAGAARTLRMLPLRTVPRRVPAPSAAATARMMRYLFLVLAYVCVIAAIIGIVIPGLPTVPFLLLAAWFSARGSTRLHRWLYEHPRFGKLLIDWETNRAVSRRSKVMAVLMLLVSWILMFRHSNNAWVLIGMTLLFSVVAAYLVSRPEPR